VQQFSVAKGGFKKIGPNEFIVITDHDASTRKPHLALHSKWHKVYQHNGIDVIGSPESSIPQILLHWRLRRSQNQEENRTSFASFLVCPFDHLFCICFSETNQLHLNRPNRQLEALASPAHDLKTPITSHNQSIGNTQMNRR
jgi:hypothetical protein